MSPNDPKDGRHAEIIGSSNADMNDKIIECVRFAECNNKWYRSQMKGGYCHSCRVNGWPERDALFAIGDRTIQRLIFAICVLAAALVLSHFWHSYWDWMIQP